MSLPALVAHYLASEYPSVLDTFLHAAKIPTPDLAHPPDPDLRTAVDNYLSSQLAQRFALLDNEETLDKLAKRELPAGVELREVRRTIEGVSATNLLSVQVIDVPHRTFDTTSAQYHATRVKTVITTSVDKTIKFVNYNSGEVDLLLEPHKATTLCLAIHPTKKRYIVSGSMDGSTILTDIITRQALQTFPSMKFVVRVAFSPDGRYLATASYDRNVVIYRCSHDHLDADDVDETDDAELASEPTLRYEEYHRIKTGSNPEALTLTRQWLIYTLRNSNLLHYVNLDTLSVTSKNFNPHPLDMHVSFAVLNLALHPSGQMIACQTGDKGAERILLYAVDPTQTERLACLWTGQDADDFVLPRMSWLPDGDGIITTSPTGHLRLLSLTGEVRSILKVHGESGGGGEVIRDCHVTKVGANWEVVSVGYDRRIQISR